MSAYADAPAEPFPALNVVEFTAPATAPASRSAAEVDKRLSVLIEQLLSGDREKRAQALRELDAMGDGARATWPALALVSINAECESDMLADALMKKIGPARPQDVPGLIGWIEPALAPGVSSGDHRAAVDVAIMRLAELGPDAKPAISALIEELRALKDDNQWAWRAAPDALREIGPEGVAAALAVIRPWLKDSNWNVRYRAVDYVRCLGISAKAVLPDVQAALNDDHASVRGIAAQTLGSWGQQAAVAAPALAALLKDESKGVRCAAAGALASLGKLPETVVKGMPAATEGQDEDVKLSIAIAMVKSGQVDPWFDRITQAARRKYERSDLTSYGIHMLAVTSLGSIGPATEQVIDVLVANLIGKHFEARDEVNPPVAADGMRPVPTIVHNADYYDDSKPWIRMAAAESLGRRGPAARKAIGPLVKSALEDDMINVQCESALALGYIGVADEHAIVAMRKLAKGDPAGGYDGPSPLTAKAGFALARMGNLDEGVAAILKVLDGDDADWRLEAAELLGKIGPPARSAAPLLQQAAQRAYRASDRRRILAARDAVLALAPWVPAVQPEQRSGAALP